MPELLIHLVSCGQRRGMGGGKPEVHFFGFTRGKKGGGSEGLNLFTQYLNSSKNEGKKKAHFLEGL